ncbi:MAG: pentapeptide repeat-containing protein [Pseudohaliea sp.]
MKGFNEQRGGLDRSQLKGGDYRSRHLRDINAAGLDFADAYFRGADLSDADLRAPGPGWS